MARPPETIEFDGDRDWFRVELLAGQAYQIDLEGSPTGAGTLSDPYLYGVYGAQGDGFSDTNDDDDGDGNNSRTTFTAPESGVYHLSAGGYGSSTGTYTLTLTSRADDLSADISTLGTVAVNGSATGEIEFDGDRDWFRVEFAAGQTYRIDLQGSSNRFRNAFRPLPAWRLRRGRRRPCGHFQRRRRKGEQRAGALQGATERRLLYLGGRLQQQDRDLHIGRDRLRSPLARPPGTVFETE